MTLFELGAVDVTSAAAAALKANDVTVEGLLSRHQQGDWGDVDAFRRQKNNSRLKSGSQLNSRYVLNDGTEVLVATAGDRTRTCVYLEADHVFQEVDTRIGYALWASTYNKGRNPLIEAEEGPVEDLIRDLPISSALDVGTGTGRYALKLARRGAAVTGIDQSPEMLALAKQAARSEGLEIDFRLVSLDDALPFEADQFDFLVCALMLSHIPDLAAAAQKFHHLLQDRGYLLLTAYHPDIIRHGWRTAFDLPGVAYGLPNVSRSRAEYLEILDSIGFTLLNVIDVPVRDVPAGILREAVIESTGDVNFCLIILAQKWTGEVR